jgi:hypothetical protein
MSEVSGLLHRSPSVEDCNTYHCTRRVSRDGHAGLRVFRFDKVMLRNVLFGVRHPMPVRSWEAV